MASKPWIVEICSIDVSSLEPKGATTKHMTKTSPVVIPQPAKQQPKTTSTFSHLSETYESTFPAMRLFAADAISLAPPITSSSVVHDNGCGPGIVTAEVLARCRGGHNVGKHQHHFPFLPTAHDAAAAPPRIEATDISPAMTSAAARRGPSVRAQVMDSRHLAGLDDGVFSHSFSGFVVLGMSTADGARVVSEMRRTLRPGGTGVLTAWAELGYVDLFESVARAAKPDAEVDTARAVLSERALRGMLELGGFSSRSSPFSMKRSSTAMSRLARARSRTKLADDGGGPSSVVELRSITRSFSWSLWATHAYDHIRRSMCEGYTGAGWSRQDKDRLDGMLADRIRRLAEHGETYHMTAWVAVLRK
ncbi:uncharacterized protein PpBr36_06203 [Pyricularia pennisetigena]|uniref:uncharacterized protein n=1 Tax=Pyricularia pennisetigena TaxID=1578925 RepID=UPI00114F92F4|nr:uncharacterized protein PpBr36_06203 [Pyricularia pennisetigena]TLS22873.1 hypothetical protein PpBr36_06203 [Pyricularia pennisetigena]